MEQLSLGSSGVSFAETFLNGWGGHLSGVLQVASCSEQWVGRDDLWDSLPTVSLHEQNDHRDGFWNSSYLNFSQGSSSPSVLSPENGSNGLGIKHVNYHGGSLGNPRSLPSPKSPFLFLSYQCSLSFCFWIWSYLGFLLKSQFTFGILCSSQFPSRLPCLSLLTCRRSLHFPLVALFSTHVER